MCDIKAVLAAHFETHRALDPQDIYKLIYQRVFGPEHAIEDLRAAMEALYLEVLRLPPVPAVMPPLIEPLSAELCRVNLQPFVQNRGSIEMLWRQFRRTAQTYTSGTLVDLERDWRRFLSSPWAQRYAPEYLDQFWQRMATAGFAAVHHSRGYTEANVPHYRVVLRALLPELPGAAS
ncbi:hypothetical protein [Candidatus Entotheonella palauensis]|uniref:Uncharacterized protein n=1 Tax=Candidatus Entotheonella gemina TaxID=1429439 RepID=W4LKW4_9BACT|nr:hypothetical protein [Candidatus Entotheonella palauensis]ETW98554.1 MAG: hypothetical protein ETSY2_42615 [Candidatus Entotheonella gemina]